MTLDIKLLETERAQKPARRMAHELIKPSRLTKYEADNLTLRKLRNSFSLVNQEPPMIHDYWWGAYDNNELVGIIHASSFIGNWDIGLVYKLTEKEKIDNFKALRWACENAAFIEDLAVAPSHRNQGVASQLLNACYEKFKSFGITKFSLAAGKHDAREYFLRRGYTKFGSKLPKEFFTNAVDMPIQEEFRNRNIFMGINLNEETV